VLTSITPRSSTKVAAFAVVTWYGVDGIDADFVLRAGGGSGRLRGARQDVLDRGAEDLRVLRLAGDLAVCVGDVDGELILAAQLLHRAIDLERDVLEDAALDRRGVGSGGRERQQPRSEVVLHLDSL
jgi:hypothetical protein